MMDQVVHVRGTNVEDETIFFDIINEKPEYKVPEELNRYIEEVKKSNPEVVRLQFNFKVA